MQKVIASVPVLDSESQPVMDCDMSNMKMDAIKCASQMSRMGNCDDNCEMMTVVSMIHFIENEKTLTFNYTQLTYSTLTPNTSNSHSTSLYRPPLFS